MGGVLLNLGPQAVDIDHDGVLVDDGLSPEQIVEHILGKDEVSGSNPDSSSKKTPVTAMVTGVFCFYETPAFLSFGVNLG